MEDAATAEISRVQIWQWREHGIKTQDDGVAISAERIETLVKEEIQRNLSKGGRWRLAGKLVRLFTLFRLDCAIESILKHLTDCIL